MRFAATCLLALGLGWAMTACGQDSGSGGVASAPAAEKPAAGQTGSGGQGGASPAAAPAASGGMAAAQPSATASSCLELVGAARFAEAIDPCTRAVREAPQNTALADALKKAQAGVAAGAAKASDTAAAAAGQVGAVQKSGSDAMKEAAGALPQ